MLLRLVGGRVYAKNNHLDGVGGGRYVVKFRSYKLQEHQDIQPRIIFCSPVNDLPSKQVAYKWPSPRKWY